jgi:hypothetical protein
MGIGNAERIDFNPRLGCHLQESRWLEVLCQIVHQTCFRRLLHVKMIVPSEFGGHLLDTENVLNSRSRNVIG